MEFITKYRVALILMATGMVAGVLGGLFGVAGGLIVAPALVFFLKFGREKARGTALFAGTAYLLVGTAIYAHYGKCSALVAMEAVIFATLGALVGSKIKPQLEARTIRIVAFAVLIVVAIRLGINAFFPQDTQVISSMILGDPHVEMAYVFCIAFAVGLLTSAIDLGNALLLVPALVLVLYIEQRLAQGISLAALVPASIIPLIFRYTKGDVEVKAGKWLALGGIIGVTAGSLAAVKMPAIAMKLSYAVMLIFTAVWQIRKLMESKPNDVK